MNDELNPKDSQYDYILIQGAGRDALDTRLRFVEKLIRDDKLSVSQDSLRILTGDRNIIC